MNNIIKQIVESKFNFNIDMESNNVNLSKNTHISRTQKDSYMDLLFVDLNLPSGTLWARYNLGVDFEHLNDAHDYEGDFYAWGEVDTKDEYLISNYKFIKQNGNNRTLIKYTLPVDKQINNLRIYKDPIDNKTQLDLEDDAAYVNNPFRGMFDIIIPSMDQWKELIDNIDISWVTNYNNIHNLNGCLLTSKNNQENLFLPITGAIMNDHLYYYPVNEYEAYQFGYYQSSMLNTNNCEYTQSICIRETAFSSCGIYIRDNVHRLEGCTIRPVLKK